MSFRNIAKGTTAEFSVRDVVEAELRDGKRYRGVVIHRWLYTLVVDFPDFGLLYVDPCFAEIVEAKGATRKYRTTGVL